MKSVHRHSVFWDVISVTCGLRQELRFSHIDYLVAKIGSIPLTKLFFWRYDQLVAFSILKILEGISKILTELVGFTLVMQA